MLSYVESVIGPNEKVLYEGKVSLWALVPLIVLGLLLLPLLIGPIFWVIAFIRYDTTELAITSKQIIAKFGFIYRDTTELLLSKVESIQVHQSILGRILNYGSIVVSGSGDLQAIVPCISEPIVFRKKFMEIQEAVQNGTIQA